MVTNYFANMKLLQPHLGTPMHVHKYWFDVLIPSGPPPEYERSGYMIHSFYLIERLTNRTTALRLLMTTSRGRLDQSQPYR